MCLGTGTKRPCHGNESSWPPGRPARVACCTRQPEGKSSNTEVNVQGVLISTDSACKAKRGKVIKLLGSTYRLFYNYLLLCIVMSTGASCKCFMLYKATRRGAGGGSKVGIDTL